MTQYDENYYMRGKETGVSNYENYRWMPDETIRCCKHIAKYLHMQPGDSVMDFGCARGFYVKAFRGLGYDAFGFDVSEWAIDNCDPGVSGFVYNDRIVVTLGYNDWTIAKDVLEHITFQNLEDTVLELMSSTKNGILIIVPLRDGLGYAREEDSKDITHQICWTLDGWLSFLQKQIDKVGGWTVCGGYKVPGVKPNAESHPRGTGFLTMRRYE